MLLPKARHDKLTVRQLPDETLIYDHLTNKAHCLNHTAGLVWHSCDGKKTIPELARLLETELCIPSAEPVIHLTLEKLARRGLLETRAELPAVRHDRRKMLRKLAATALPIIMTITAPRAAQAASKAAITCPPGQFVCAGECTVLQGEGAGCAANCQCGGGKCVPFSGIDVCCFPTGRTGNCPVNGSLCCSGQCAGASCT